MQQFGHIDLWEELGADTDEICQRASMFNFSSGDKQRLKSLYESLVESVGETALALESQAALTEIQAASIHDIEQFDQMRRAHLSCLKQLFRDGLDDTYIRQRLQVGLSMQHSGLYPKWCIGSYSSYLAHFFPLILRVAGEDMQKLHQDFNVVQKALMFDMSLLIDTFINQERAKNSQLEQALQDLMEGVEAVIWEADAATFQCTYVSPQAARLGYSIEQWLNEPNFWGTIIHPADRRKTIAYTMEQTAAGHDHAMEYRVLDAGGRVVWMHEKITLVRDSAGIVKKLRGVMVDISENKTAEQRLNFLSTHDDLTGLPNRSLLLDRIPRAMRWAKQAGGVLGVMVIGLDRLKLVNDSLGHHAGDTLLKEFSCRLANAIGEVDTLARLSGDEFVVLHGGTSNGEDMTVLARQILEVLEVPFSIDGREVFLSGSVGISIYPKDGDDEEILIKNASAAAHRAKEHRSDRYEYFSSEMNEISISRLHMESDLRRAIEHNEFVLYYQPQLDLGSGRIIGVEALIRWHHPDRGIVPPDEFIATAEETGLIVAIGDWVLRTACAQAVAWQSKGFPLLRMAVNLSGRQFFQHGLVEKIERILQETMLQPSLLELELTESMLMESVDDTINILQSLRKLGVRLSIDDFGTGYSSLSYLRRFPVSAVKIDRSFVQGITNDPDAAALVRSIIAMSHEMRLRVIAEGVETEGQLEILAERQCNEVQGYYISRPVPADDCLDVLEQYAYVPETQSMTSMRGQEQLFRNIGYSA